MSPIRHVVLMLPHSLTVGRFRCHLLEAGRLWLDGGAMFGVVPKNLWQKRAPADDRNRILLGMRPLVVRGARTMLIDAGLGDKDDAKFHEIYGVDRSRNLDHTLAEAGLSPADIDIVLASLHDHAGQDDRRLTDRRPSFIEA